MRKRRGDLFRKMRIERIGSARRKQQARKQNEPREGAHQASPVRSGRIGAGWPVARKRR